MSSDAYLASVAQAVAACVPPNGVLTRIVGIDGHGAGKTTLAERLANRLKTQVVHTDDFASWANPVDWYPQLRDNVLKSLAAGRSATYLPTQRGDELRNPVVIEPGGLVIIEGVTAIRSAFRPYLAYRIWVETPREVCLQRGLARDGEDAAPQWEHWLAQEDQYIEHERPQSHADVVVRGHSVTA